MYNLCILTPAIPREEIHNRSIVSLYQNIKNDTNWNIIHIINVDSPKRMKERSVKCCIDNLKKIIPYYVDYTIIDSKKANFTQAYLSLFKEGWERCKKFDKCFFLWFEDDWLISNNISILQLIEKFGRFDNTIYAISLRTVFCSNNPIVYGYKLFEHYVNFMKRYGNTSSLDPDYILHNFLKYNYMVGTKRRCRRVSYNDKFEIKNLFDKEFKKSNWTIVANDYEGEVEYTVFHPKRKNIIANDIGREWMRKEGMIKWNKESGCVKTYPE